MPIQPSLFSFSDPNLDLTNTLVYWDTSMVIELYGQSKLPMRQKEVQLFHQKIATTKDSYIVTSSKCWDEVPYVATSSFIAGARTSKYQSRKETIDKNPGIIAQGAAEAEKIGQLFANDINHILSDTPITQEIRQKALDLMKTCDVEYADALHYVLAKKDGITYIATLDSDFIKIPDPNLHIITNTDTCNKIMSSLSKNVNQVVLKNGTSGQSITI